MSSTVSIRPNGQLMDLIAPSIEQPAHPQEVSVGLSHIRRFGGSTDITVEEHAITMALSELYKEDDPLRALYMLCHDNHEAFCGDIVMPVYNLLDGDAKLAIDRVKAGLDDWIFESYIKNDLTFQQRGRWAELRRVKAHRIMDQHSAYREIAVSFGGASLEPFKTDDDLAFGTCRVFDLINKDVSHATVYCWLVQILCADTHSQYVVACQVYTNLLDAIGVVPEPRHFASIPFMKNQQPDARPTSSEGGENA